MLSLNIYVIKRFFFAGKEIYMFSNMLNQKKKKLQENKILDEQFL